MAAQTVETSNTLLELLRDPPVIGLLLMLAIIVNVIWMIWCTKAYEDPSWVLDTKLKITALWRDYTPCGILSVFSGRRERGWTLREAQQALDCRREANRQAEARALAEAIANRQNLKLKHQSQDYSRFINKPNRTTIKSIQKSKRTNKIRKKNVQFLIKDYVVNEGFGGNLNTSKRSIKFEGSTERSGSASESCRRTSFRKINVTYKRPLPPLPAYTFEDKNVKIVISDIYDRIEIPKSDLNQDTTLRYECRGEGNSGGRPRRGVPVGPKPRQDLDDLYEPVGLEVYPYTEELELFV